MQVPPCAYCGAPLEHKRDERTYEAMWVVFYQTRDGGRASTVKWGMHPPSSFAGRVEADGFICSKRCTRRRVNWSELPEGV